MSKQPPSVLCVDDDTMLITLIRHFLRPLGVVVIGATSLEQALSVIQGQLPDLILLDVMMPGLDGWQILRYLRDELQLETPVIVVTAHLNTAIRPRTPGDSRYQGYISKPFSGQTLRETVQRWLNLN